LVRNSELDARNAFSRVRPPLQREIAETELDGPLGNKVRFLLAGRYYTSDESATVHAAGPAGPVIENVPTPQHNSRLFGRLDFDLTPKNTLTLSYKFKNNSQQNQGVGAFNFAERATDFSIHENEVKVFERAFFSATFLNELHFAFKDEPQQTISVSDQPANIVLGAFSSGGAQINLHRQERAFTIQDAATFIKGKHSLRVWDRGAASVFSNYRYLELWRNFHVRKFDCIPIWPTRSLHDESGQSPGFIHAKRVLLIFSG
jgi:hypothetical protein